MTHAAEWVLGLGLVCVIVGIFRAIERRCGEAPRAPLFSRSRVVDALHLLTGATVTKALAKVAFLPAFVLALAAIGAKSDAQVFEWLRAHGPLGHWPRWAAIPATVVLADGIGTLVHRAMHEVRDLWKLHAIHHSAESLDFLAGVRNHPFAEMAHGVVVGVSLLLLGLDPRALVVVPPVLGLYGLLLHANVPWRFGALRYVIVTPRYHRWHHAALSETGGRAKNFAGLFPVWDLLMGTYFLPDREPARFGAGGDVPAGFLAQLLWSLK